MPVSQPLVNPDVIEAWAREHVRPTALARRDAGSTEPLLREALRGGMSDWLLDGQGRPAWSAFLPRVRALGRGAADLGFGVGVMVQNLVTGLHLGLNVKAATAVRTFERARAGELIVSFAVTEPDVGAHPGRLKSRAEKRDGAWHLTGVKTFSTNGFWADEVIMVAVSGEEDGKKRFVAVTVPANAPGFSREEIRLPVCPTSTHATFRFDVDVPEDRQVGEEGSAYLKIVRPFRAYEDMAAAALFLGHLEGMERDAEHLAAEARGRLRALIAGLDNLIAAAGAALDQGANHDALRLALTYLLEPAVKLVQAHGNDDPLWQARANDLGMSTLGANVRKRFFERLGEAGASPKTVTDDR